MSSSAFPSPPPDASSTRRGLLNTIAQSIQGAKTWLAAAVFAVGVTIQGTLVSTVASGSTAVRITAGSKYSYGASDQIYTYTDVGQDVWIVQRAGVAMLTVNTGVAVSSPFAFSSVLGFRATGTTGAGSGFVVSAGSGWDTYLYRDSTTQEFKIGNAIGAGGVQWLRANLGTGALNLLSSTVVGLTSGAADGATAVAVTSDTAAAWVNASAKLHSFRNNTVEKSSVLFDGNFLVDGVEFGKYAYARPTNGSVSYNSADSTIGLRSSNGGVFLGISLANGVSSASGAFTATSLTATGGQLIGSYVHPLTAGQSLDFAGYVANGAAARGLRFANLNALTTAGAKIASFYSDNFTTEKASIDKDGELELTTAAKGVILKSPNGTRYRITVSDAGALVVAAA